ncbi:MarR family transcriptional regulator [Patescibacteria group bacterium]|nr:MarR family transcriptional regulator [Patescibacteria group bacterium]
MRLTVSQRTVLQSVDAKSKASTQDIADVLGIPAGPAGRCAHSLAAKGLLKAVENKKTGEVLFSRTSEGSKLAKTLN